MNSATLPSFWAAYRAQSEQVRQAARKTYRLWQNNPFHPSLHFKCVDAEERIWSVRITIHHRALGVLDADTRPPALAIAVPR